MTAHCVKLSAAHMAAARSAFCPSQKVSSKEMGGK